MSRYESGYRLELRVRTLYAENGWLATRFPKSGMRLYPADILAVRRRGNSADIHLVECKNLSKRRGSRRIYIESSQIEKLRRWSQRHRAEAFIAYSFPYQRAMILPIDRVRSDDTKYFVERDDGEPLEQFLSDLTAEQSRL